jgi:hypothetical protein
MVCSFNPKLRPEMRQNPKLIILSAVFLLVSFVSCKPRKAIELREAIVQKERTAYDILLAKNGPETQKLDCLVKDDYKGALAFVDKEEQAFNKLIKEIEALPADGIEHGNELKTAALSYYAALKELHVYDRREIEHQEITLRSTGEELRAAQHKILELSRQKQTMYKKVYEEERKFHEAMENFNSVNRI